MSDTPRPIDLELFDTSASPADDFYRYVNGGWLDANSIPPEYPAWGAFMEVRDKSTEEVGALLRDAAETPGAEGSARRMAGDYFAAAMDEDAIAAAGATPLAPYLERIDAADSADDLRALMRDLQHVGVNAFHSLGIASDFEDNDAYLVYLGQGGLGLPERGYYLNEDEGSVALRAAYVAHIANQLRNLGDDEAAAAVGAGRVLAFETSLAEPSLPAEELRDVEKTLNRFAIEDLDALMPAFGLSEYTRSLGVTTPSVSIDNPAFFEALETTLADADIETLRAYLRWQLIATWASSLSPEFENEAFEFYGRTLGGQQKMRPRWKRVLDHASTDIGEQVARLYVDEYFSEQAKERCEEMVDHILSAMGRAIRELDWMSETTKEHALEKLAGFGYKIGFPDSWRDYSGLEITRESHAANRLRAATFEYDREFGRLGEPVDKTEWAMPAHTVNAYYHPLLNEIVFPAAILQPPFFYADADIAVNYGGIGAVIAHEITHGFDDNGRHFDANGSKREWWTAEDANEFSDRTTLLVDQFAAYEIEPGVHVNGQLTLGENIADLGGVTISFNALQEALDNEAHDVIDGFTPEQRFFIAYASIWRMKYTPEYARLLANIDPHSPTNYRTNGPLSNFPPFAEAFDVPTSAPMSRPAKIRVKVW